MDDPLSLFYFKIQNFLIQFFQICVTTYTVNNINNIIIPNTGRCRQRLKLYITYAVTHEKSITYICMTYLNIWIIISIYIVTIIVTVHIEIITHIFENVMVVTMHMEIIIDHVTKDINLSNQVYLLIYFCRLDYPKFAFYVNMPNTRNSIYANFQT